VGRLGEPELVCAEVLLRKGRSTRSIAEELGVHESTLRYRLTRRAMSLPDGRKNKPEVCAKHADFVAAWMDQQDELTKAGGRPASVHALYDDLVSMHGYRGSYKAVVRFVRRRRGRPKLRPKRRVETLPGAQVQVDWAVMPLHIDTFGGVLPVSAFCMTLSHSRMWVVVWCNNQTMLSWLAAHNLAFNELGGVATTARIDNLKTGVAQGAGPWSKINKGYQSYAQQMGFIVNPCLPARGDHKGKVERRVRDVKWILFAPGERFASLESLQAASDLRRLDRAQTLMCPVTGRSVFESWRDEVTALRPLPMTLPTPFDVQVSRPVADDCLVSFEGRRYQVPFLYMRRTVDVRGCAGTVEIYSDNKLLRTYPRGTECRLLIDQDCYEGDGDDRVSRPMPLGALSKAIVAPRSWETARRPIDQYARMVDDL
jgi:transposase